MFINKWTDDSNLLQESNLAARQPRRATHHVIHATTSEELVRGPYVEARVGFEPATFLTEGTEHHNWATTPRRTHAHTYAYIIIYTSFRFELVPLRIQPHGFFFLLHLVWVPPASHIFNLRDFKSCCIISASFLLRSLIQRVYIIMIYLNKRIYMLNTCFQPSGTSRGLHER